MSSYPRAIVMVAGAALLGLVFAGCFEQNAGAQQAEIPESVVRDIKAAYARCIVGNGDVQACVLADTMMAAADFDARHGTDVARTPPAAAPPAETPPPVSGTVKRFPQVTLRDDPNDVAGKPLAVLEHRGGDAVEWRDHVVNVFLAPARTAAVATWSSDAAGCAGSAERAPVGTWSVGDRMYLCSVTGASNGSEVRVQIVDSVQNAVVYENAVVVLFNP